MDKTKLINLEKKTLTYILNNKKILNNRKNSNKKMQRSNAKLNLHNYKETDNLIFIYNIHIIGYSDSNIEYYFYLTDDNIYKFRYNKKLDSITFISKNR